MLFRSLDKICNASNPIAVAEKIAVADSILPLLQQAIQRSLVLEREARELYMSQQKRKRIGSVVTS